MDDNGSELEGDGLMDENETETESEDHDAEDDAILHEKDPMSSPRDNI